MNYYNQIKRELINNEVYKKTKDYSKNRSDLNTYYNVGKLIVVAQGGELRSEYGNKLIKEFSIKFTRELGKGYSWIKLYNMRQYYLLFSKNPILIKSRYNYTEISEKKLKQLILEDIPHFLKELVTGFTFIENEYKIKIGNNYNYIDLLLFNYKYNCFVVVELKVTELKKEHIGQIQVYMNYVDKNIKSINQDKTIGIIICKKENEFIIEYSSDSRIFKTSYELY